MKKTHLSTSQIAKAVGVHPNTVRLYEAWGYIAPAPRSAAGYRLFSPLHLDQMRLARWVLQYPYPGGKSLVEEVVQHAVRGDLGGALERTYLYLARVRAERVQTEAAVEFLERWAAGNVSDVAHRQLYIGEAASYLEVSRDALRNWERNGLIEVPRHPQSGYRLYSAAEFGRLRVIRTLRRAGYSMMAVLRMLTAFDRGSHDLRGALETPAPDEDVYTAADKWITALVSLEKRVLDAIALLERMMRQRQP